MSITTSVSNDVHVIKCTDKVDVTNVGLLKSYIKDMMDKGVRKVLFDFADLVFIDSSGVGAIAVLYKTISISGGKIAMINNSADICHVFKVTGLGSHLIIKDKFDDAMALLVS